MSGALEGIRVVDFGQYIAGPLSAMFLADQGAEVIRIDPPGGPRWDTPANATWNRGKRSFILDLKRNDDLDTARDLVASADVLIENFRPGIMDRLGLGAEAMTALNPALVYCSLPGFASDDPRAALPGWEGAVGAATDLYHQPEGTPVFNAVPTSSTYAAFLGATSIAMALQARARDGRGQRIEVPLFDATLQAAGGRLTRFLDRAETPPPPPSPWGRGYQASDGRWIHFSANDTRARQRAMAAAGVEVPARYLDREQLRTDAALAAEVIDWLERLFLTRPAQEWEDLMNRPDAGAGCSVCRDSAEWLEHPHAHESRMVVEVSDPQYGRMLQPGVQVHLSRRPGEAHGRRAPEVPDALRAAIASHTPSAPPSSASLALRSALEGVKVLDLCIILAGPTCGRTLAEFGADVIKLNDPWSEYRTGHEDVNRGKRHLLADLKTPEGRDLFWQLVDQADVVVQNFRQGAMDALGLGYEQVKARRPDIVYVSLNTFGSEGPWANRRGWEEIAQAATGMQRRYGGNDARPAINRYPVNDYGTGIMGAYGVALALIDRQRTGLGQHVSTGLAYTACALQSPFMQAFDGKVFDEPRGQQVRGFGPLQRFYRASDGWLFLGASESQQSALGTVEGLAGIESVEGDALAAALEARIAAATTAEWSARLASIGVIAQPTVSVAQLMDDPWVQAHGLSLTREHEGLGRVTTIGPAPRLSRTPVRPGAPAAKPGADVRAILDEIGRAADYDGLLQRRVIAEDYYPMGETRAGA